jgi:RNA polymerase sigma-70 factor (ECF subfamily)
MAGADPEAGGDPHFHTTRWSLVARAADLSAPDARSALETLASSAWYPLYVFLRRRGHPPEEAEDLVQGLFARLVEKDVLAQADPARGRFRTYLLTALKYHASHERERAGAQKRGGDRLHVPIDAADGERRYGQEPVTEETPEVLFERAWAHALLDRALGRLTRDQLGGTPDRARRFEALQPILLRDGPPQAEVAEALGMTPTAVKVALHRLRRKLGALLREDVASTLDDPGDVDDELARLAARLRGG